jgi:hypothetical protein
MQVEFEIINFDPSSTSNDSVLSETIAIYTALHSDPKY